jgi:two-component system, chemotaxis family, sensor kinase CheA
MLNPYIESRQMHVAFKKKQFIALGLTIFFLFVLLFVILGLTSTIKSNMLEIVQDRYDKVNRAMEIRQDVFQSDRRILQALMQGEEGNAAVAGTDVYGLSNNIRENIHNRLILSSWIS